MTEAEQAARAQMRHHIAVRREFLADMEKTRAALDVLYQADVERYGAIFAKKRWGFLMDRFRPTEGDVNVAISSPEPIYSQSVIARLEQMDRRLDLAPVRRSPLPGAQIMEAVFPSQEQREEYEALIGARELEEAE